MTETMAAIRDAVLKAKKILLHCHPHPDPDSYGSALGLYHYLRSRGREATIIRGDSPRPDFAAFLPGAERIIDKTYSEINPADFDLFVILDSGGPDRVSALGPVVFPPGMKTILIDHHLTTKPFADLNWVDATYAATAEMLAELLTAGGETIPPAAATCFLVGLYTDTGGFKYPATGARTFRLAAALAEISRDYAGVIFKMENNHSPGFIRFQALAFGSVQTYFNDRVAIAALDHRALTQAGLQESDAAAVSLPNILKSVVGWEVGISLTEWQPGLTGVSARTRDATRYDLTKFSALLDGGGHSAAAGARLAAPLEAARRQVLDALTKSYPLLSS